MEEFLSELKPRKPRSGRNTKSKPQAQPSISLEEALKRLSDTSTQPQPQPQPQPPLYEYHSPASPSYQQVYYQQPQPQPQPQLPTPPQLSPQPQLPTPLPPQVTSSYVNYTKPNVFDEPYVPTVTKKKTPVVTTRFKPKNVKEWVKRQHHLIKWASVLADTVFKEYTYTPDQFLKWEEEVVKAVQEGTLSSDRMRIISELDPNFLSTIELKIN